MYRNDCRLTCWNQNCDTPIRFRAPVCQMNENCQISDKSQHNFYFLPYFISKTTEPIFTISLHDVEQLAELLTHSSARRWCISFQNTRAKRKTVNFDVCKNPQKLTSLGLLQNVCEFYNPHTYVYQCWNVGEDWFSSCWDIRWHRPIFASSCQKYKFLTPQSPVLLDPSSHTLYTM